MPYAEPTSPIPSPAKEYPHHHHHSTRRGNATPPAIDDNLFFGPSSSGPMPGIPRRSSSNHSSGTSTPRRGMSPGVSRQVSASTHQNSASASTSQSAASRPLDGLPRRTSTGAGSTSGISGLPNSETSSLGLRLNGVSPTKPPSTVQRSTKESTSSTSSVESNLPLTPTEEPSKVIVHDTKENSGSVFEPSIKPTLRHAPRGTLLPGAARPTMAARRSSGITGHHRGGQSQTGSLQIDLPTSVSTPHLPPTPHHSHSHSHHLRPIESMIRKKSGELVKPSLKQRSMSTPDLTRRPGDDPSSAGSSNGGSAANLADERAKSVRFAGGDDAEGERLEHVVLFSREQKVTAVSKAADPDGNGVVTETETEGDTDGSEFVQFRTRRNAAALAADEAERLSFGEGGSRVPRVRVDFVPDARGCLTSEFVVLERVELQNNGSLMLKGTAIVRNTAFQKWVAVRFTLDHWQTVSEVSGTHVGHIPSSTTGDEGWDRFSFVIKLEDYKRKIEERQLLLCVRFSVDGREWWDSNDGANYKFTFKKNPPKRPIRSSGSATFGGGFMRLNEPDQSAPIPGLRIGRGQSQAAQINRAFGVTPKAPGAGGWLFPKLGEREGPARSDSPLQSPPPAAAYMAPAPPDVHDHLQLKKYCAPSPPSSPLKDGNVVPTLPLAPLVLNPTPLPAPSDVPVSPERKTMMNIIGGNFATAVSARQHERRRSWTGGETQEWSSFSDRLSNDGSGSDQPGKNARIVDVDATPVGSIDGDSTPVANGARSPENRLDSESSGSSPDTKPMTLRRSSSNLQALLKGASENGLMTPPSSNLSSPPSPRPPNLPTPMSPSYSSLTSTGESSPINTIIDSSTADLANLSIENDPAQRGGMSSPSYKMLSNSYQEFLDKFCFFQSPSMTPSEEPQVFTRPSFIPLSGASSPNGFPFYGSGASNSPRNTPTPTGHYNSAQDAFNFYQPQIQGPNGTTPRASPNVGVGVSPPNGLVAVVNSFNQAQPMSRQPSSGNKGNGPYLAHAGNGLEMIQPGYTPSAEDAKSWSALSNREGSPSIAAAH